MLLNGEFPPDDRVRKEAVSLIDEGFEVHILCFNFGSHNSPESIEGIFVHRIQINKRLWDKLFGAYLMFPLLSFIVKKRLTKLIENYAIKYLHIHDLPLSGLGVKMKKKYGLKLICDQHEYFSNWIVNTASYNKFPGIIIKHFSNWKSYEKRNLKKADLVITVEEPLRECYINEYKLDPKKIILVPNTPLRTTFSLINIDKKISGKFRDHFVLLYIGGIDILRGIDTILESVNLLKEKIPNILFLIAGKVQKGYNLKEKIKELGIEKQVRFMGWVDIEKIPSYINASDICLFTPLTHWDEINKTIATKIYQYLSIGKPVIVSSAKYMKDFIENNQLGFAINDSADLSAKITKLHDDKELYNTYSKNASKIIKNYYWDETIKTLIYTYKSF